jgi:predicted ATP-dependent serine protease
MQRGGQQFKLLDQHCHICGHQLNSWDGRCSKALKFKNASCEGCISKAYDMRVKDFRPMMENYFGMRPCMGI